MAKQPFPHISAAAIDGRTRNIYYRQTQLQKLYTSLVSESASVVDAIIADSGYSHSEAEVEFYLTIEQVRARYVELNPEAELEAEYAIARGDSAEAMRMGVGIVVIEVNTLGHNVLFSAIAPLAGAIAAGNCVIIQMENSLRSLPSTLMKLLKKTLDSDTFDIAQLPIPHELFTRGCLRVLQNTKTDFGPAYNQLASTPGSVTVAAVDRTADLDNAAKTLINARFVFKGKSPYAPDIVLVNEFVKKEFLQALLRHFIAVGEVVPTESGSEKKDDKDSGIKHLIADLERNIDVRIIAQERNRAILDLPYRSPQLLRRKVREPCLIVHGVKSLDDAIDFINGNETQLLAAYHWGSARQCKYLSQFVFSQASFANHIPTSMLVGPAYPRSHPVLPSTPYPAVLFSTPTPAFTAEYSTSRNMRQELIGSSPSERAVALRVLKEAALQSLPVKTRKPPSRAAFGFFEQAMLVNLGAILVSTITVIGGSILWINRAQMLK